MKKEWHVLLSFFGFCLIRGSEKNEVTYRFDMLGRSFLIAKNMKGRTCWNICIPKGRLRPRQRMDLLFSVSRIFLRGPKIYVTAIYIGQIQILVSKTSEGERGKEGIKSESD